jgi:WD40 repeat protein
MNKLCSNDSAISLVDVLSNQDFENLLSLFHSSDYPDGCIQLESFKAILEQILNIPKSDKRIDILCKKIDIDEDGVVDENKLITYFLQQFQEREAIRAVRLLPFQESPSFIQNIYSKQSTCQIMHLYNPSRFISISKDGVIATWSSNLQLQKGTIVDDKAAIIDHNEFSRSKKRNIWISDATIIDTYNLLVISTTSRELNFYDITSNVYKCIYRLCDIPSLPICLSSHVDPDDKTCYIFIGDSNGSISIFHFTNPLVSLFAQSIKEPSEFDNAQIVMHSRLSDHSEYVTCTFVHNVHADWILQIKYLPQNHSTITCAQSHQNSVVLRDIEGKRKPYQFNLKKGVTCFDFNWKLNLLITGSSDHIIRFWDPYVPTIPTAILKEHTSPIIDVLINIDMNIVFSFSRDLVMCAWDIYEHTLLQTVSVKFPFSQRQPEFSSTVLFLLSPTKLAVTCNEYISVYPLGDTSTTIRKGVVMSHAKPLIGATYDPRLQQVVSGCENGDINVWDINSGAKTYNFKNCHNNTEVTFTSLDGNNRYLITGSRLGEVKVWNYSNGECLHEMHTLDNTEITGVVHVPDKAQYLAAGWNRRISSYTIKPNIYTLQPDGIWSTDVPHHSDDILTIAYCPPYYMATGSFDGDIIVWNIDTTVPFARFKTITQIKATINLKLSRKHSSLPLSRSSVASVSRPASRQLLHRNQSIV